MPLGSKETADKLKKAQVSELVDTPNGATVRNQKEKQAVESLSGGPDLIPENRVSTSSSMDISRALKAMKIDKRISEN